jgi:hypothetical protein
MWGILMVLFPNTNITIYREMPHGTVIGHTDGDPDAVPPVDPEPILLDCGSDGYDNKPHCLMSIGTVIGDLQPLTSVETMKEYGSTDQTAFKLNLNLGVDIKSADKIKANGYDGYFQVRGDPLIFKTLILHMEVNLTKERD